jgi:hypothetical protein
MKKITLAFSLLCLIGSCRKDKHEWVFATVTSQQGCFTNSRLVRIDHPDHKTLSFLCDTSVAIITGTFIHCGNAVVILDFPSSLSQDGTKIKFRRWKFYSPSCYSSSGAPNHVEAEDIRPL